MHRSAHLFYPAPAICNNGKASLLSSFAGWYVFGSWLLDIRCLMELKIIAWL
jgi:hypothetical protein